MPVYTVDPAIMGVAVALIVIIVIIWWGCSSAKPKKEHKEQKGIFSRRHKGKAVAYCASCGKLPNSSMNDLLVGRRFICPKWELDFPHIGAVIKEKERYMECWLHIQRWLQCYSMSWSLSGLLSRLRNRIFKRRPALSVDIALIALIIWLLLLLPSLFFFALSSSWLFWPSAAAFFAAYSVGDSLLVNTSVTLVTQQPRLPLRSVILGGFAFLELSLAFAVFYALLPVGAMNQTLHGLTAWYFSLVTIVTLGYGDFHPCSPFARSLVMVEIVVGLYFLYTLFATIVSWATASDTLPTLAELIEKSKKLDEEEY